MAKGDRKRAMQGEALTRAVSSQSLTNYPTIYESFMARGIPESEILPRENVFTYNAWIALGRQVRRGEHGIKVCTFVPMSKRNAETGEPEIVGRVPRTTTVFHITQTDPIASSSSRPAADA
jgi:antirestriction protein ArdC